MGSEIHFWGSKISVHSIGEKNPKPKQEIKQNKTKTETKPKKHQTKQISPIKPPEYTKKISKTLFPGHYTSAYCPGILQPPTSHIKIKTNFLRDKKNPIFPSVSYPHTGRLYFHSCTCM